MDSWDLKKWRKKFRYNQFEAAAQLGVTRATIQNWERAVKRIPYAVELACEELGRRWKRRPEFGPVLLVYADGLVRGPPTDVACIQLLQCEPHATNEAAIRRVIQLREAPDCLDPVVMFIMEEDGGIIWSGPELLHECDRPRKEARTKDKALATRAGPTNKSTSSRPHTKKTGTSPEDAWRRRFLPTYKK